MRYGCVICWMAAASVLVGIGCSDSGGAAEPQDVGAEDVGPETGEPCGGCGAGLVCDESAGECVGCVSDDDCGADSSGCNTETNTCITCPISERVDWYPDVDGDGFGEAGAEPESVCDKPGIGWVENADDCDDTEDDVHPDATEICNGIDDNCSGETDESAELDPVECARQTGVCQGATIERCDSEAGEFATCGADDYGDDYVAADDEAWRCDGADNDCDGSVDEACCAIDETPIAARIGDVGRHHEIADVVPALDGAPSEATHLVVWRAGQFAGQELKFGHVDRSGRPIGRVATWEIDGSGKDVLSLDVVRTESGYAAAYALYTDADAEVNAIRVIRADANLQLEQTGGNVGGSRNGIVDDVAAAADGREMWIVYSYGPFNGDTALRMVALRPGNGTETTAPFDVSSESDIYEYDPDIAVIDGRVSVVWALDTGVWGAQIEDGAVDAEFSVDNGGRAYEGESAPVALAAHRGAFHLLYPYTVELHDSAPPPTHETELRYLTFGRETGGALLGGTALTESTVSHTQPVLEGIPAAEGGEPGDLLAAWSGGDSGDAIRVGRIPSDSPGDSAPRTVASADGAPSSPAISTDGTRAGIVWKASSRGSSADTVVSPLSLEGVPLCAGP